jgi:hypothetical protein
MSYPPTKTSYVTSPSSRSLKHRTPHVTIMRVHENDRGLITSLFFNSFIINYLPVKFRRIDKGLQPLAISYSCSYISFAALRSFWFLMRLGGYMIPLFYRGCFVGKIRWKRG